MIVSGTFRHGKRKWILSDTTSMTEYDFFQNLFATAVLRASFLLSRGRKMHFDDLQGGDDLPKFIKKK